MYQGGVYVSRRCVSRETVHTPELSMKTVGPRIKNGFGTRSKKSERNNCVHTCRKFDSVTDNQTIRAGGQAREKGNGGGERASKRESV